MLVRVIHFLRPTFFALIAFALIVGVRGAIHSTSGVDGVVNEGSGAVVGLSDVDLTGVVLPSPRLTPDQIVRLQLAGLGDPRADGVGILQCYAFASPANRAMTGHLDRFGKMVRQGPFQCLARPRALLVGRPHIVERTARVVVTVVDEREQIHVFTFLLTRQLTAPFQECWMTEAVWPSVLAVQPTGAPAA
jgi:Domain of unknown function (DUF4864)